jgi:hypothetical protein
MNGAELAEKILALTTEVSKEDIEKTIQNINQAESTYGLLWGLNDLEKSGKDLDFYMLKKHVLEAVLTFKSEAIYPVCYILAAKLEAKKA